ncbi:MAG: MFS transporter [Bdellovibrionales bacterium]|nr:MFS transporter [Bdellovibrionales bacterium]
MQKKSESLNPTIKRLGTISFFADVASEMLYPITPIFLTAVLGASMSSLGVIEGAAEATASLLKTFSGVWSDKLKKRKPFIVLGYFLGAISKPLIGVATQWTVVLGARCLDRTGKGLRSAPRDALISESVTADVRGSAFGWHRGMDTLGAAVGPLLTIGFLTNSPDPQSLKNLYFLALIPGLISVYIALTIKETKQAPIKSENKMSHRFSFKFLNSNLKKYFFSWGVFSLANSSDVFLLMRAKSLGLSMVYVVGLYCFYNLMYSFCSPFLGKISDHIPRKKILIFGLLIYALVYLGLSQAQQGWQLIPLFAIYGLYMAATDGIGKAITVDFCEEQYKGTALGFLGTVSGLTTIIASTFAGLLWDKFGPSATFYYGALGAIISALLLLKVPANSTQN